MNYCYDCDTPIAPNRFRCDNCYETQVKESELKRRRPMTEWEKQKIKFVRDSKYWEQSIRTRGFKKAKDGKKYPVHMNKAGKMEILHNQPKELLPEPKRG